MPAHGKGGLHVGKAAPWGDRTIATRRPCCRLAHRAHRLNCALKPGPVGIQPVQQVIIPVNKSVTMTTPASFSSAVVGSPEIADALPMTDRTLLIQAKKIGTTNVSIYDENSRLVKVVDVQVTLDTGNLQSRIRALTGDRGIRVSTDNGQIVLSGIASNGPAAIRR